jgi:hypothetical protein
MQDGGLHMQARDGKGIVNLLLSPAQCDILRS